MAVDREGKAVGPQISEELAKKMSEPCQKVTVIDEEGKVLPCDLCTNPHPGMAHKCTDYLWFLIEKFGGHTDGCARNSVTLPNIGQRPKCDCGWDEVKRP